ncbi:hypothetical protein E2C01_031911 [Portunus trituberculatus]|uniref:Uncharacterized protein n=1 Tax=Portunus trituberculatus TaxID=210409 RepID=A0A5B7EY90_PORTR|nr:hypothetical protein [Portunus trituberculatus]
MKNVCLHAKQYHLCYTFSSKNWVSDMETVIIPGKSSIIPPQVPPNGRVTSPLEDPEKGLEK